MCMFFVSKTCKCVVVCMCVLNVKDLYELHVLRGAVMCVCVSVRKMYICFGVCLCRGMCIVCFACAA